MRWDDKKEVLEDLIVKKKLPYEEIGRMFNCTGNNIKKVARRLNIQLDVRRQVNETEIFNKKESQKEICKNCQSEFVKYKGFGGGEFCSKECRVEYRHKMLYQKLKDGTPDIMRPNFNYSYYKSDIMEEQGNVCDICKCEPIHNGKELPFVLDHIDGDSSNNKRENLRCICPNCNSQLETRKRNSHKSARYYYKYGIFNKMKQYFKENNIDIENL